MGEQDVAPRRQLLLLLLRARCSVLILHTSKYFIQDNQQERFFRPKLAGCGSWLGECVSSPPKPKLQYTIMPELTIVFSYSRKINRFSVSVFARFMLGLRNTTVPYTFFLTRATQRTTATPGCGVLRTNRQVVYTAEVTSCSRSSNAATHFMFVHFYGQRESRVLIGVCLRSLQLR